jgi:hypothetical protein
MIDIDTHMNNREYTSPRIIRWLLILCAIWCGIIAFLVIVVQVLTTDPLIRAVLRMVLGVIVIWIIGGGLLSFLLRYRVQQWFSKRKTSWQLNFIIFATVMALIEEAVTTSMTNLAPLWGVYSDMAAITASNNYLVVVLLHSVIVFIPMFVAWSWLLKRYLFPPLSVLFLFGVTGVLAEIGTFGLQNIVQAGFWIFVYGFMVFLPACAVPVSRKARVPGIGATLLAIIFPIIMAIPMALIVQAIHSAFFPTLP